MKKLIATILLMGAGGFLAFVAAENGYVEIAAIAYVSYLVFMVSLLIPENPLLQDVRKKIKEVENKASTFQLFGLALVYTAAFVLLVLIATKLITIALLAILIAMSAGVSVLYPDIKKEMNK